MDDFHCPECKDKASPLVKREPLPSSVTETTSTLQFTASSTFQMDYYGPTQKIFKCTNPNCWVSNIEVNWK